MSYWNNELWDTNRIGGSASSVTYDLVFANPAKVSDLVGMLGSIKTDEQTKEKSIGSVMIGTILEHTDIIKICKSVIEELPTYEEYKDKPIVKGKLSVCYNEFNFTLEV